MQDLNDLFYFAKVVEHGGFMAAGRALGIPKSRLSRRIAELEDRLGVRLLQRTTRRLALTEVGGQYYQHCQAVLTEAEAAEETIARIQAEPRGLVRVSCPELLAKSVLAPILPRFLAEHPQVRVQLEAANRRVDLIEEGIDIAIRVRNVIEDSANQVARTLSTSRQILTASPRLLAELGTPRMPSDLLRYPCLTMSRPDGRGQWVLLDGDGHEIRLQIDSPRLMTDDLVVLAEATARGLGVALLPQLVCQAYLTDGRLQELLPDCQSPWGILHLVYPSRRGLIPAVRLLIDFLTQEIPPLSNGPFLPLCPSEGIG
ncbi:MAG: LysR family transcriptional regulator [Paludibacterium sp.]|uniref:LysR substrate-binding domain-containing protein n=1 Tax=Paludibacterium sp. TaxID=1917523 RepID=UPI0025EDBAE1|nr:LysR substrate-binding domain-containing protein [Paludibacterium sp.]MBV8045602.1 LysR family transcriptional regulator [Paludibacterium sp.]MBV8647956.1 LysR family transcriptional regulator [Paludibacterium sp.]